MGLAEIATRRMATMGPRDKIEATLMAQMVTLDVQFRRQIAIGNCENNDSDIRINRMM